MGRRMGCDGGRLLECQRRANANIEGLALPDSPGQASFFLLLQDRDRTELAVCSSGVQEESSTCTLSGAWVVWILSPAS